MQGELLDDYSKPMDWPWILAELACGGSLLGEVLTFHYVMDLSAIERRVIAWFGY